MRRIDHIRLRILEFFSEGYQESSQLIFQPDLSKSAHLYRFLSRILPSFVYIFSLGCIHHLWKRLVQLRFLLLLLCILNRRKEQVVTNYLLSTILTNFLHARLNYLPKN